MIFRRTWTPPGGPPFRQERQVPRRAALRALASPMPKRAQDVVAGSPAGDPTPANRLRRLSGEHQQYLTQN